MNQRIEAAERAIESFNSDITEFRQRLCEIREKRISGSIGSIKTHLDSGYGWTPSKQKGVAYRIIPLPDGNTSVVLAVIKKGSRVLPFVQALPTRVNILKGSAEYAGSFVKEGSSVVIIDPKTTCKALSDMIVTFIVEKDGVTGELP